MKCSHCGNEVEVGYIGKDPSQVFCDLCIMTLSHTSYKPTLCSKCGVTIPGPLVLSSSNGIFCSMKCFAESIGFREKIEEHKND